MPDKKNTPLEKRSRSELMEEVIRLQEMIVHLNESLSGKKMCEEQLLSCQIRFKDLFNKSQDGIIILGYDTGNILKINFSFERIFGYSEEELINRKFWEIDPFENLLEKNNIPQMFWKHNRTHFKNLLITKKDNQDINAEFTWCTYHLPEGKIVQCEFRDNSASKQLLKKLNYERKILRTLIDSFPDLIYVKDRSCKKIISNLADVRNVGYETELEVIGKDDFDLYPKEVAEKFYEDDKKIVQSRQPVLNREEWVVNSRGEGRWLQTSKIPLMDDHEKIIGIMGIGRDITKRKLLEESLKNERNFLRKLIDNLPDLIYLKDINRKYILNNLAHLKLLGVESQETVIGKSCFDFYPKDLAQKYEEDEIEILSSREPKINKEEIVNYTNRRDIQWHLTSKLPLFDNNGKITGILGISRNITEQKRSEEKIRKLSRMYELQSYINQLIVHSNNIPTLFQSVCEILVQTGEFKMSWVGLFEKEKKAIKVVSSCGETGDFLEKLHMDRDRKEYYDKPTDIVIETGEFYATNNIPKDKRMMELHELAQRNGFLSFCAFPLVVFEKLYGIIYIYSDKSYFFDEREIRLLDEVVGDISFCIETISNNQEREKNEQEMINAVKKAEEANRLKDSFLARVSHEFRTPITGIIGNCNLLQEFYAPDSNETVNKLFDSLNEDTDRLLTTITHILDIANIESDNFRIECKPLPYVKTVLSVCENFESLLKKKNLGLEVDQPENEIIVLGDEYCLNGAIKNILDNATKFSDKGTIRISMKSQDKFGVCTVEDEGYGMSEKYQEHLFELFSQEDVGYSRQYDGPGLGLALTKKFISYMKGEIQITSKKGAGTVVIIKIPLL